MKLPMRISPLLRRSPSVHHQPSHSLLNEIQVVSSQVVDNWKGVSSQISKIPDMLEPMIAAGRDGALLSLALGGLIYPLASLASHQCVHGTSIQESLQALKKGGGASRAYQGLGPAALGVVLGRFCAAAGDMAATKLLQTQKPQWKNPITCAVLGGVLAVALYCPLLPIETLSVTARSQGQKGVQRLLNQVAEKGVAPLYAGAMESISESLVDHLVWYSTRHALEILLPEADSPRNAFFRNCLIGAASGLVSDCFSYPINVVKTHQQVLQSGESAVSIAKALIQEKGVGELWRRGFAVSTGSHLITDSVYQGVMVLRGHGEDASV